MTAQLAAAIYLSGFFIASSFVDGTSSTQQLLLDRGSAINPLPAALSRYSPREVIN
jgi:hypothetical protein